MERKQKNSLFSILLNKTGLRAHKEDLLSPFGVESCTELEEPDLDALIARLQDYPQLRKIEVSRETRLLRSKVILIAEDYFNEPIKTPDTWTRFNRLMMNPRIMGKMLWEMSDTDLKTVHKKLHKLTRDITAKRQEEIYKASQN